MKATTSQSQPFPRFVWYGASTVGGQPSGERSATRPRLLTRTRLLLALVGSLLGAAAVLPVGSGRQVTASPGVHSLLPAGCAFLGDGRGLFVWPLASCGGAQVHLRAAGFGHAEYVLLHLVSPQGGRSDSPLALRAGADGMLKTALTIPAEALGPGKYIIEATGLSSYHTTQLAYIVR
jgi:hypothetical protein